MELPCLMSNLNVLQDALLHVLEQGVFQGEGTRTCVVRVPCLNDSERWFSLVVFRFFCTTFFQNWAFFLSGTSLVFA